METLTQNQTSTIERLRSIYFEPKKMHKEGAYTLVQRLTQKELINEFNDNHNKKIKCYFHSKEYNTRFSYEKFLLQHIRK